MSEFWQRISEDLVGRLTGPLPLRLFLQPMMAVITAVIAGYRDARTGRPPYTWTIFAEPSQRRELLRQGWADVMKVFVAAALVDVVYQVIALRWVYPGETLIVAFLLAIVPYLLIRGLVGRIVRMWLRRERAS